MSGEKKPLTRQDVAVIVVIGIAVIASLVALIRWKMGKECVRWSTRIDVTDTGAIHRTQVCAEFRPRQSGEESPFDLGGPKAK